MLLRVNTRDLTEVEILARFDYGGFIDGPLIGCKPGDEGIVTDH